MAVIVKGKNARKTYTVRYWDHSTQRERSFVTRREANDFKIKAEHDARANIFVDPDVKTPLSAYFGEWIESHAVSPRTRSLYRSVFANHVEPAIGHKPIGSVTRDDIRDLLLVTMPKTVGPSAVAVARKMLTAVFGEALKSRRIAENPASGIRIPAEPAGRADILMATHKQLAALVAELPSQWELAVWLMRGCGLRVGEALAVRADSVRGEQLRAEEQVLRSGTVGPLKSRKPGEFRDMPLPRYVRDLIGAHVKAHRIPRGGYLFPMFTSGEVKSDVFYGRFMRAAKLAGLPADFSPHSLRHIYASALLAGNVSLFEVSRYLGHRSTDFTAAVYGHLVPSAVGRAVTTLDAEYIAWSKAA